MARMKKEVMESTKQNRVSVRKSLPPVSVECHKRLGRLRELMAEEERVKMGWPEQYDVTIAKALDIAIAEALARREAKEGSR